VNGKKLRNLRLYGAKLQINEIWMLDVLRILLSYEKKGVLDVGVNIGQTLIKVKSIDEEIPYVGFEPNPSCIMYCEELIRINHFRNVELIPTGLFTENRILSMDLYHDDLVNSGGSVVEDYWAYVENYKVHRTIKVPLYTFDTVSLSLKNTSFNVIKIDVEGAELEVLKTLEKVIISNQPFIIMEVLSAYSTENKIRYERQLELEKFMENTNYKMMNIIEDKNQELVSLEYLSKFDVTRDKDMSNYLLYPEGKDSVVKKMFSEFIVS
jgi:FkbM family methyltransferase